MALSALTPGQERRAAKALLFQKIRVERSPGEIVTYMDGVKDHPFQKELHFTDWRFMVCPAGRRAGKTISAAAEVCESMSVEGSRNWIVAPDYGLTDKVFEYVYRWLVLDEILGHGSIAKASKTRDYRYIETKWGSFVQGKSAESPSSLIGDQLDLIVIDECARIPEIIYTEALASTLIDRRGRCIFISTPRGPGWFKEYFDRRLVPEKAKQGWAGFRCKTEDNPFLSNEELEELRSTLPPDVARRELDASFEHFTGLIYPDFRDELYNAKEPGKGGHLFDPRTMRLPSGTDYMAIDVGWRHPTCCLWLRAARVPEDYIFVYREHVSEPGTPHEVTAGNINTLNAGAQIHNAWISPDAKRKHGLHAPTEERSSVWEVYRDHGLFTRPANDNLEVGIEAVRAYLAATLKSAPSHPKLFISTECTNLRRGLSDYIYSESRGNREVDAPETPRKYKDDEVDSLRYGLVTKPRYVRQFSQEVDEIEDDAYPARGGVRIGAHIPA